MDKIIETFEKMQLKAINLKEAMIVIPHKSNLIENFGELSENNAELVKLEAEIKKRMQAHNDELKRQYDDTNKAIKRIQEKMLVLLQHLDEKEKQEQQDQRALQEIVIPGTPKLFERAGAVQAFSEPNTPRMMISDYAKSPFAKKRTKIQLQFTDFEAEISNEDFSKIPSYMKGRIVHSDLQEFLDNVIIRTFNFKYQILFRQRSTLKPSEFSLQTMFKDQTNYFEGQKFITVGDIARMLGKNVDKRDEKHLQMLRHLQIIREARKNSVICYIWLKKSYLWTVDAHLMMNIFFINYLFSSLDNKILCIRRSNTGGFDFAKYRWL